MGTLSPTHGASLQLGMAVPAYRYAQGNDRSSQPSPRVPLGGASLFSWDVLRLADPVGKPIDLAINTHTLSCIVQVVSTTKKTKKYIIGCPLALPLVRASRTPTLPLTRPNPHPNQEQR